MIIVAPKEKRLSANFVFSRRREDPILPLLQLLQHFIRPADSGIDSPPYITRPARQGIGPPHHILMLPHPVCMGISDFGGSIKIRSEEHTSELQSRGHLV